MSFSKTYDVVVIGAGAAGFMCAVEAGKRKKSVLLLDHAKKPAEKVRISGGGRCNFTNLHIRPEAYLSENPHFFKSALKQYTQHDFIDLVRSYNIPFHEKTLGQLFCDNSSKDIINMLLDEARKAHVTLSLETEIQGVNKDGDTYQIKTSKGQVSAPSCVIATGGLSIPKMGATGFAYDIAKQFSIPITKTRAGLVPLTYEDTMLDYCKSLAGVAVPSTTSFKKTTFKEALLFTHRGLSGPSILQISSYWDQHSALNINLAPDTDMMAYLKQAKSEHPKSNLSTILGHILPKRLADKITSQHTVDQNIAEVPDAALENIARSINHWSTCPNGSEGYRTAEVTLGGIDTNALSSKTMEAKSQPGLYFIGECVDVTGHLGGYNFQWAWSSGFVAGQNV